MNDQFSQVLLDWYSKNARSLPWRGNRDPYAVWVSEIMLQQTRVDTVIPYFERWMKLFPTLQSLAEADEQQVLNAWEGLGYYTRARGFLKAARMVVEKFGGRLPENLKDLMSLPGIGRYTAAAISSIAYGADEAVLDGNVKRVLARAFNFTTPVNTPEGETMLWRLAESLLPVGQAGEYNQAVMDLGATICTPRSPDCEHCPLNAVCEANKKGLQDILPVMLEKAPIPHITVCAAIIQRGQLMLIARRPSKGLLGGLWEFPGGKVEVGEGLEQALTREIREELGVEISVEEQLGVYKHAYTHFRVTLHAFHALVTNGEPAALHASEIRWVKVNELADYPMGKIDRRISDDMARESIPFSTLITDLSQS
jgi:A/G-specific adenine glycosylase